MKKTVLPIVLGILMLATALAVTGGNTKTYDLSNEVTIINSLNYTVVNGSNSWFNVSFNNSKIYVTPDLLLESGNYTLIFDINGQKEVTVYPSGGSSSIRYYTYKCSSWGDCINGYVNRTCKKKRVYFKSQSEEKPDEFNKCIIIPKEEPKINNTLPTNETISNNTKTNSTIPQTNKNFHNKKIVNLIESVILLFFIVMFLYHLFKDIKERKKEKEEKNKLKNEE